MDIQSAIRKRRTIRRFQSRPVSADILNTLVELSRLYASGGNQQPIRFGIVSQKPMVDEVFRQLAWAMYLPEFEILPEQQPPAYIVLLRDNRVKHSCQFDVGAAATTLMLAAEGFGLSTCCLGSFQAGQLQQLMGLASCYHPELVIAVGYADQKSDIVDFKNSVCYYQDISGELRVPKYSAEEVLIYSDVK